MSAASKRRIRRPLVVSAAAIAAASATVVSMGLSGGSSLDPRLPHTAKEYYHEIQGVDEAGGAGGETKEITSALAQFNDARNAPGFAQPGGYTMATDQIGSMDATSGSWDEVTKVPYNSDDPRYRDYYANTTAGSGYVTGRTQALATDDQFLYAAGAVGGVERLNLHAESTGWTSISGDVPALSSGALAVDGAGRLWYATGDGSTGATTYTGDGVWVNETPQLDTSQWKHVNTGDAAPGQTGTRDNLFDGAVIQQLRFSKDGYVYAPTSYGLWRHSVGDLSANWEPVYVPNPDALPTSGASTGTHSTDNYVTDVAIDPSDPNHVVVARGWVAGGSDNGWYDGHYTKKGGWSFTKSNVKGAINPTDIGRTTFAWGSKKLYALVHNPDHASQGVSYSELDGVYVSSSGSVDGPWAKIADSQKLAQSGSALDPTVDHAGAVAAGYQPGVQAWYNQFLAVDPSNDDHVYVGLEEVYETKNGGSNWTTPGPYWNFFFDCWGTRPAEDQVGCNPTTHSDQHAVAIGDGQVFVGNDGGIYARPIDGQADKDGHATDWQSLTGPSKDGSITPGTPDFLQYYAVGIGSVNSKKTGFMDGKDYDPNGVIVSGGLQDNGGSILFTGASTEANMGSNFGGDGGDVLVDPDDGCQIVQEYVDLSMRVTNECAAATGLDSFENQDQAHTRDIAPPDSAARFTAPFAADHQDIQTWLAGGRHVWLNTDGFAIKDSSGWKSLVDLGTNPDSGAVRTATAVASDHKDAIVSWCGSCGAEGFAGGIALGRAEEGATWKVIPRDDTVVTNDGDNPLPNRMIAGADVYHDSTGQAHYLIAVNGFSRRWVEGPGAGVGHVFESTDGHTWTDLSTGLPDVPANTVKYLGSNGIAVGTDLGAFLLKDGTWKKLGDNLPMTVVDDLEPGPDGNLYAATYGRGIWKLELDSAVRYDGSTSPAVMPTATAGGTATSGGGKATKGNGKR